MGQIVGDDADDAVKKYLNDNNFVALQLNVLKTLIDKNGPVGIFLLCGVGVAAAVALFSLFAPNAQGAFVVALYLIGLAALTYVVVYIVSDPGFRRIVSWLLIIILTAAVIYSGVRYLVPSLSTLLPPVSCILMLQGADCALEVEAAGVSPPPPVPTDGAAQPAIDVDRGKFEVYVQFAGVIQRDSVRAMMKSLEGQGWGVEGADGGGERTADAAGLNAVKHGPGGADAAKVLAGEVQALNVSGQSIGTSEISDMAADRLEVWISR